MEKDVVVMFTKDNARIYVNPENLLALLPSSQCLINPDMSAVKGLPPHFWKADVENNAVKPMSEMEMFDRLTVLQEYGSIVPEPPKEQPADVKPIELPAKQEPSHLPLILALIGMVLLVAGVLVWSF